MATRKPSPALLIIDMFSHFDFADGERLAPLALDAAHAIAALRAAFDERGWPVIYSNDNFGDWKCGFRELVEACLRNPGPAGAIATLLRPDAGHYSVLKPKHSAFLASPLQMLLQKLEVDTIVLAGMALDSCVLATAIDAKSRELRCLVANEATAALPGRRAAALQVLQASGTAEVVAAARLLSALQDQPADSGVIMAL